MRITERIYTGLLEPEFEGGTSQAPRNQDESGSCVRQRIRGSRASLDGALRLISQQRIAE
jgi:hypothetical protein